MDKEETVNEFLAEIFDKTLIADLKQMMMSHVQGLDFAIIILVCSGIELMGALDNGKLKAGESKKCFQEALEAYFPDGYLKCKEILYKRFRCGLAHQGSIKPGTATARNPTYRDCHLKSVRVEGEDNVLLFVHPDVFAEHFFQAVQRFRASLKDSPEKIEKAYQTIEEIYRDYPTADDLPALCTSMPSLPSDGASSVTRMPLPILIKSSEASMF